MKDSKELNNLSNVMTNGFNEQLNLAKGFLNLNKKSKSNKEVVKLNKEQLNNKIMIDMVLDENLLNLIENEILLINSSDKKNEIRTTHQLMIDFYKLKECILNTEELSKLFKFKSKDLKSLYDFIKLTNKIINDAKSQKYYNIMQDAYFDVKFTDLEYEHVFSIKKLNSEFNDVKKLNSEFLTKIFNYRKDHTIYFGK